MSATAEEIWVILRELTQSQKETDRKFQETDRKFQETDRKYQEMVRDLFASQKETDRKFQETDRKFQETDRKFQETDRKIKEVTTAIGRLGNRLGEFVEEMVRPAVVRLFQERGIAVHEVHRGVVSERGEERMEVDLLVVNDTDVIDIEVKSELSVEDVQAHVGKLGQFKKLFPHYRDCRVLGAVAAMVTPEDAARYAYRQGLFVLGQSGETVVIRNDAAFRPKAW